MPIVQQCGCVGYLNFAPVATIFLTLDLAVANNTCSVFSTINNSLYIAKTTGVNVQIDPVLMTITNTPGAMAAGGFANMCYSVSNNMIYGAIIGSSTLAKFNPLTNTQVGTIALSAPIGTARGIYYSGVNNRIYVNLGNNTVDVINPATDTVLQNINFGVQCSEFTYANNTGFLYTCSNFNSIARINPNTNVATADGTSTNTIGIIYVPSTGKLLGYGNGAIAVSEYDPVTRAATGRTLPPLGGGAIKSMIYNPNNNAVYAFTTTTYAIINASAMSVFSENALFAMANADPNVAPILTCYASNVHNVCVAGTRFAGQVN